MMRIHTKALALSCGLVCGVVVACVTLAGALCGYGVNILSPLTTILPGYSVSPLGSVVALGYGFLKGALCAGAVGVIYNKLFVRL